MALQKSVEQNNGIIVTYHRVIQIYINQVSKNVSITVGSYLSKEIRDVNKSPVINKNYILESSDFDTYFTDSVLLTADKSSVKQAYLYLKTLNEFSNAIDC